MKRVFYIAVVLCSGFFFIACPSSVDSPSVSSPETEKNQVSGKERLNIVPVFYTEDSLKYSGPSPVFQEIPRGVKSTLTFFDLTGQNVFLVKVNTGGKEISKNGFGTVLGRTDIFPQNIKGVQSRSVISEPGNDISGVFGPVIRHDFEPAKNPDIMPTLVESARSIKLNETLYEKKKEYTEEDIGSFKYPFYLTDSKYRVTPELATLVAIGTHCYIWAIKPELITDPYKDLSKKFDLIYPIETNLLGFEKGGGLLPGKAGYGGIDGDPKIHILLFDIDDDETPDQTSGVVGYFYSLDDHKNSPTGYKTSNEAEIFYLDSHFFKKYPAVVYSTLIHEFQHMIHYNNKGYSATWYNEMLSMLAEDVLISHLELSPEDALDAGPIGGRIPTLNAVYDAESILAWGSTKDILTSYANTYSFGAYLLRNFGGAELLYELLHNSKVNEASVTDALQKLTETSINFESVLADYWKSFLFSGKFTNEGEPSFDTTSADFVLNNYTYTVLPFDIWNIKNRVSGEKGVPENYFGPLIYQLASKSVLKRTFQIQSTESWLQLEGDFSVNFDTRKMTDPTATMFLVVR